MPPRPFRVILEGAENHIGILLIIMREKNIFIGILVLVLIGIGAIIYRAAYKGNERPLRVVPMTPIGSAVAKSIPTTSEH